MPSFLFLLFFVFSPSVPQILVNEDLVQPTVRDVLSLLLPSTHCTKSFESFLGLCLLWNSNISSWGDAESTCSAQGGHLVWLENAEEHQVMTWFARSKKIFGYFWIGLHRLPNKTLVWSSGSESSYRIGATVSERSSFVASSSMNLKVLGAMETFRYASICRQNRSEGDSLNIMNMILNTKLQTDTLCPRPWVRKQSICLMYFHTQRTWSDAEYLCFIHGGSLVWFEDEEEHRIISEPDWPPNAIIFPDFWTALYNPPYEHSTWSGGFSDSPYRGSKLRNPGSKYFFARFLTASLEIVGARLGAKKSIVCRRPL